ncbi:MAG: tryptophan halogenase family protein [Pseudohongiellaceae bacterium]
MNQSPQSSSPSQPKPLRVVVAGGGTSGWLAAAALGKLLGKAIEVSIIESEAIGRIGVGEATIPPLRTFHRLLGIDEPTMMRETQATVKLGIEFTNWGKTGESYIHSFGVNGQDCWACEFQHFWLAGHKKGLNDDPIGLYCRELIAAREGKAFAGENTDVNYAFHFDAGLYAEFLKRLALKHGVKFIEGVITEVNTRPADGHIESLSMQDGSVVEGDLFLDCTGFRALLINGTLKVGYETWGHFLPCNAAVAVQSEKAGAPRPYTQAIAHGFGWQWRIPLQHRMGNGLVYSADHVSDEEALNTLLGNLESKPITEPRAFKYQTGRRAEAWNKNCIAIGLAAGFLEPVESTSIHLAMSAILRLLKLFPQGEISPTHVAEYNQQTKDEMERVRNFIILHYHATQRDDTEFWRHCRAMPIPPELEHRIKLFRETGAIPLQEKELFRVDSWTQVMLGQHIVPQSYHPIVDAMPIEELTRFLEGLKARTRDQVAKMPSHQAFLDQYCKAAPE